MNKTIELNEQQLGLVKACLEDVIKNGYSTTTRMVALQIIKKLEE